jgi:signal-transduction protein with cAMP-binding, CBS, and nucleotidyltransferase domain
MKVADINSVRKSVVVVPSSSRLGDVARSMRLDNIGAMVVSSGGQPMAGIVTERDIVHAIGVGGPAAVNLTAAEVMTSPVPTCSPDDRLTEVMQTMLQQRIRHLPLVEGGRLVGMVSMGDVIKGLVDRMELEANVLRDLYLTASSR